MAIQLKWLGACTIILVLASCELTVQVKAAVSCTTGECRCVCETYYNKTCVKGCPDNMLGVWQNVTEFTSCNNGTTEMNTSREATTSVNTTPESFTAPVGGQYECVDCDPSCKSCEGSTSFCTECTDGYYDSTTALPTSITTTTQATTTRNTSTNETTTTTGPTSTTEGTTTRATTATEPNRTFKCTLIPTSTVASCPPCDYLFLNNCSTEDKLTINDSRVCAICAEQTKQSCCENNVANNCSLRVICRGVNYVLTNGLCNIVNTTETPIVSTEKKWFEDPNIMIPTGAILGLIVVIVIVVCCRQKEGLKCLQRKQSPMGCQPPSAIDLEELARPKIGNEMRKPAADIDEINETRIGLGYRYTPDPMRKWQNEVQSKQSQALPEDPKEYEEYSIGSSANVSVSQNKPLILGQAHNEHAQDVQDDAEPADYEIPAVTDIQEPQTYEDPSANCVRSESIPKLTREQLEKQLSSVLKLGEKAKIQPMKSTDEAEELPIYGNDDRIAETPTEKKHVTAMCYGGSQEPTMYGNVEATEQNSLEPGPYGNVDLEPGIYGNVPPGTRTLAEANDLEPSVYGNVEPQSSSESLEPGFYGNVDYKQDEANSQQNLNNLEPDIYENKQVTGGQIEEPTYMNYTGK